MDGTRFRPGARIVCMRRPDGLKTSTRLKWSAGTGESVWALFQAIVEGDRTKVESLLAQDPALVNCHHAYRTPIYFAVRENRVEIARLLLERGADPVSLAVNDSMIQIATDRGLGEMESLVEEHIRSKCHASGDGNPVAEAIRALDRGKVRALLDASPQLLHAGDETSNQPIHWAVMTRQIPIIDDLLARGADINAPRFDGARPIQLFNGDYGYRGWRDVPAEVTTKPGDVLRHLIARGAHVDIHTASHTGDLERVRKLLDEDPSLANRVSDYVTYYLGSGTPLRNAAARGHLEIVRLLLERGADPNLREEGIAPDGHALYSAVYNGHHEVAELLLECGAYPSPAVESSADAMSIALMNKDDKMVELLASYGGAQSIDLVCHDDNLRLAAALFAANPELVNNADLFHGVAGGDGRLMRLMLRLRPDLATRIGRAGKTRELTEFLFAKGMDPNHRNWLEAAPLHELASKGDVENAALFLDHGADIHARDEDIGSTPLGWAAKFGRQQMVEFLLSRGAHARHADDPPWAAPAEWARRRGHAEIVAVLDKAVF